MKRMMLAGLAALGALAAIRPAPAAAQDASGHVVSAAQLRARMLRQDASGQAWEGGPRSVPLAFGMSMVLPGAGQAYNRNWIRSAAAAAIEGGLLVAYFSWRGEGRAGERAYQAYAHRFWDPVRYASWLNDYADWLEAGGEGMGPIAAEVSPPPGIDFMSPQAWTDAERRIVREFFDAIHAVERAAWHPETGAAFSHELPYFGEQQYYELIGKYFQFAPGWADYPAWKIGEEFTAAIDPERTGANGSKPNVQGRFLDYAEDHARANTLLRRASRISAAIALNHVLAAFDAAISARLRNRRIETSMGARYAGYGAHGAPELSAAITWRF